MMFKPVVLITGALKGIGRATALAFARQGSNIAVSGRNEEAGQALAVEMRAFGATAEFILADVRYEQDVSNLIKKVVGSFGRLDVAVNNAGTEGKPGPAVDFSIENYASTFDTNVLGTLLCIKHELPVMIAQGSGCIVNLSSIAGKVGMAGASVYVASKHAVEGLTKAIALEVAAMGIRVNAIAPGPVESEMLNRFTGNPKAKEEFVAAMPAKRAATVEEVADTILFVASDKARYITGQSIVLDGGFTAQ